MCAEGAIIRPIICTGGWCSQLHLISSPSVPVGVILDLEAVPKPLRRVNFEMADPVDAISKARAVTRE